LIAANSLAYWQNQQQRQAEKRPVFIEDICEDWY
jgi:exo-beta-1,3-glucanase (GH17 family)